MLSHNLQYSRQITPNQHTIQVEMLCLLYSPTVRRIPSVPSLPRINFHMLPCVLLLFQLHGLMPGSFIHLSEQTVSY